jgi:PAS domain S-box-containing protein
MTAVPRRRREPVRPWVPDPLLRAFFDAASDAFILLDTDDTIRAWNHRAAALLGWTADEAVGRSWTDLIGATASTVRHRDGTDRAVETDVTDIVEHEHRWRIVALRERSHRTLGDGEQFQAQVLDNVRDSVIVVDQHGRVRYWNRGAEAIYGYSAAEMLGCSIQRIHPPGQSMTVDLHRILESGESLEELERVRKDGTTVWVDVRRTVMRDAKGAVVGLLGVAKDVTERRRVTAALEESHGQLRSLADRLRRVREEERSAIARQIHDEMGQVLTALRLDVSWLEARLPAADQALHDKCAAMARLIEDTIGHVRVLATELRPAVLDDLGLSAAIEWEAQGFARRTGIPCDLRLAADLSGLDADRATDLFRILQEALTNVARHARARQVGIRLELSRDTLLLQVDDDGRGITATEAADPRALGLLGMRERALRWSGAVEVQARRAGGTSVTVRIPLPCQPSTP